MSDFRERLKMAELHRFSRLLIEKIKAKYSVYQKDIANRIGENPSSISKIQYEYSQINVDAHVRIISKLLETYEVDSDSIIEGVNEMSRIIELQREKERERFAVVLRGIGLSVGNENFLSFKLRVSFKDSSVTVFMDDGRKYTGDVGIRAGVFELFEQTETGDTSSLQVYLNDSITLESMLNGLPTKYFLAGGFSSFNDTSLNMYLAVFFKPELFDTLLGMKEELLTYFYTPELQTEFLKANCNSLDTFLSVLGKHSEQNRKIKIEVPKEFITSYQQFLGFFVDYIKVAKGAEIRFDVIKKKNGLEIIIDTNGKIKMETVGVYLKEYLGFTRQNIEKLKVPIEGLLSEKDFNLLILDLKHQITSLRHSLDLAQLKNQMLSTDIDYFKQLSSDFAKKNNVIHTQVIHGGNQQYADKINNSKNEDQ